jgi:4-amino-4-deoxy-L-arabinose transferase-like glycosyltransferase
MELSFMDGVRQNAGRAQRWVAARPDSVAVLLIAFAVLRILSTLNVYSATADEPLHVTAGLQIVAEGRYAWQLENPPLPRLVFGALVRLGGAKFDPHREPLEMMRWLFYSSGHYRTALFLARSGNLLFFVLSVLAMWSLARRTLGSQGGLLAVLLFTTQPVLLGYTGIANLDIACMAGVALALLAFWRWLENPTIVRALLVGAAYGLSIGLKLSNLLFVPAACLAVFLAQPKPSWRRILPAIPVAMLGAFFALWASYGFAFGSLKHFELTRPPAEESGVARALAAIGETTPIPMPHLLVGLAGVAAFEGDYWSYAFGRRTKEGWWWYFPAALMLKTAMATLLFAAAAFRVWRTRALAAWIGAVAAILLVAAPSSLDLGVRYVLPVYVPLTIAAAGAALAMLRSARKRVRVAAITLVVWQCAASLIAHPDYFPYFNELAGPRPGWALLDSNLDWGQDLLRLRRVVRAKKIDKIGIIDTGLHDFAELGYPPSYDVNPWVPSAGWIAVGEHMFRMTAPDGGFWWLRERGYQRVGKSIRLYYVP